MTDMLTDSIYDEHGGEDLVDQVASSLYARLVMDHEFGPVLMSSALGSTRLLNHQRNFISLALGGPCSYSIAELRERSAELGKSIGLTARHRDVMLDKLRYVLAEAGLRPVHVEEAIVKVIHSLR